MFLCLEMSLLQQPRNSLKQDTQKLPEIVWIFPFGLIVSKEEFESYDMSRTQL